MDRPKIQHFFGDKATLKQVHETYLSQPKLFNYTQSLDNYIDYLEDQLLPTTNRLDIGELKDKFISAWYDTDLDIHNPSQVWHWINSHIIETHCLPSSKGEEKKFAKHILLKLGFDKFIDKNNNWYSVDEMVESFTDPIVGSKEEGTKEKKDNRGDNDSTCMALFT